MGISVGQITESLNLQPTVYTGFTVPMYNFQGRELEKDFSKNRRNEK